MHQSAHAGVRRNACTCHPEPGLGHSCTQKQAEGTPPYRPKDQPSQGCTCELSVVPGPQHPGHHATQNATVWILGEGACFRTVQLLPMSWLACAVVPLATVTITFPVSLPRAFQQCTTTSRISWVECRTWPVPHKDPKHVADVWIDCQWCCINIRTRCLDGGVHVLRRRSRTGHRKMIRKPTCTS